MTAPRRVLHLWLPHLPTDRLARLAPPPPGTPVVTVEKTANAVRIEALNAPALALGLQPGQPLAEARAQHPHLVPEPADPVADGETLCALARAADRYTPLVGLTPPDGLTLDITGCAHLFGGEAPLRDDLLHRLRRWGFAARAAVASRPAVAWALARHGAADAIVPPGGEAEAVAPLPVTALRLAPETVAVLHRLGLKTIRDLLRQPRAPLVQRFGPLLARRIDQLEGAEREPITPETPVPPAVAERQFAEPVHHIAGIEAALPALAGTLEGTLRRRGEGARRLTLRLFHADGTVREVAVGASEPLADPARIAALLKPRLRALQERTETDSGIDLVRLHAEEIGPLHARQGDLDGHERALAELAILVDTLAQRLGADAVARFTPVDTHQPAAASRRDPARDTAPTPWPAAPPHPVPERPLKLFTPPEPVETLASVPDGPPVRFVWRRVAHHVAAAEGPERIAPEWWTGSGETADYFRVEDAEGRRFWMFRRGLYGDGPAPAWFVHGLLA